MYKKKGLILLFLINALILGAYFVCKSFASSEITVRVYNNNYSVYLNNRLIDKIKDQSFNAGGLSVYPENFNIPYDSPIKPKVEKIEIKDLKGRTLFSEKNTSSTGYKNWENFAAKIKIKGVPSLILTLHEQKNSDGIVLVLRGFFDIDYGIKKIVDGRETILTSHTDFDLGIIPGLALNALLFLQSFPSVLLLIALNLLLLFSIPKKIKIELSLSDKTKKVIYLFLVTLLIATSFMLLLFINLELLEGVPHVPDSIIYMMQAKIFARGKIFASPEIFKSYYQFFDSLRGGMLYLNEKWFSQYPFGHPLILAIGVILGMPWLIPPIVSTATLILLTLLFNSFFGRKITILLLFITLLSPLFQSNGANFMSHGSALFFSVGFVFFFFRTLKYNSPLDPFLSSLFFGLFFNTRILTAFALFVPFSLYAILNLKQRRRLILFLPGLIIFFLLYLGYNWALTGNPLINPYQLSDTPPLGFSPEHTLGSALLDSLTNSSIFLSFVFGWPQKLTLLWVFVALILPPLKKTDLLFLTAIISIISAWLLFDGSYIMYGPRYYYEILPFVLFLTGSGISKLMKITMRQNLIFSLNAIFILLLSFRLINGWLLNQQKLWEISETPSTVWELRGFNNVNSKLLKLVNLKSIHNALIFVKPCTHWWCDAVPASYNNPDFNGDIIWAKDLGFKNKELFKAFPNRKYYLADYETVSIVSYDLK
ncbi:hypothetical protein A2774_01475 [Candidatus Roizmanbacteria bacterium RIFCSPHIGHO2_01_FULL_39_12c]|uniref:Glycosyltransferase RgtA/B/C/D-like domain-containing protein n=1 Tax=Candidatus Roizmanbacteria bacterium RIFCSPHIGHO2_01_FULL_39_12c TaxID=1802031 RepID=A0A1F7G865_9BACT|nr:MAG: hypothetical protein A2774_01475 [Candidatus Roizmanbacteria bacterium RIFCSPHIGHO2_01_FULL_39_12c]OGK46576.1 MAG: hypothetical protein A2963_02480 [Candidatus Roizmanbacteria bacterium RIFCSPLOWO2_01_FULL_40_13]